MTGIKTQFLRFPRVVLLFLTTFYLPSPLDFITCVTEEELHAAAQSSHKKGATERRDMIKVHLQVLLLKKQLLHTGLHRCPPRSIDPLNKCFWNSQFRKLKIQTFWPWKLVFYGCLECCQVMLNGYQSCNFREVVHMFHVLIFAATWDSNVAWATTSYGVKVFLLP